MVKLWTLSYDDPPPNALPAHDPEECEQPGDLSYAVVCQEVFSPWFAADSWSTWRVLDKALFGEALSPTELVTFKALTGRDEAPSERAKEAWLIAGRRSGKDVKAASICVYLATIGAMSLDLAKLLVPGERGVVQLLAVDRKQAAICLGYIRAMLGETILADMVVSDTSDGIELSNGLIIEVTTNDKRSVRGRTVIAVVFDEVAFWRSDNSVNPDKDVYDAVKPAMATIPGAMLIGISSPYARKGLLYEKYRKHYGKPGPILVAKAPTWVMNPTVPRDGDIIGPAYEDDPAAAAAEYGAEFRSDIETFISGDVLDACTTIGANERSPRPGFTYFAFADPSGGSVDPMALAIAHYDHATSKAVLDLAREIKPPFDPDNVVKQFAAALKAYGLHSVTGDHYAKEWVVSSFAKHDITYEHSTLNRSQIYLELLPALNGHKVNLLDISKLHSQFVALERRTSRSGRDSVDHPTGGHDDLVNAAAGALVLALSSADTGLRDDDAGFIKLGTGGRGWSVHSGSEQELTGPSHRVKAELARRYRVV